MIFETAILYGTTAVCGSAGVGSVVEGADFSTSARAKNTRVDHVASQEQVQLTLMKDVLFAVTLAPGLDDEEIAVRVGAAPFLVSVVLRKLQAMGAVHGE